MIWQLDLVLFGVVLALAVLALRTRSLLVTIPILSAFSLVMAVMFAGMAAVDVAFVEAVLGAGLSGLILLLLVRATGDRAAPEGRRARAGLATLPLIATFVGLMVWASTDLPARGDPDAPAHQGVAADHIARSEPETRTPNVVTTALADFRSQDTLGEVVVIFTAGSAVVLLLHRSRHSDDPRPPGDPS